MKQVNPIFEPQPYDAASSIRLVNPTQIAAYWANGCIPKDIYVTRDFKTNRPAAEKVAEVPSVYIRQLGAYRKLLAEVYPGRKIETWILWTDTARLMEIA